MAESKNWIAAVNAEMKRKGTVGSFTKQAKRAGMSVHDFAMKVKENPEDYSERTHERATLALTFEKMAKDRKYAAGGKTQGYNDKLDEDLGKRLGRESVYKQSLKDRRDESKAGNKTLGRRAYASVDTMDKGDRMFMHGGKTKYMQGGMSEKGKNGYIAFYKGKQMEVYADSSFQAREKAAKSFNARKSYDVNVVLAEKDGKQVTHSFYAKGGKTQGYDAREDESLGMRTGKESTKKQDMKARREDSYGKWGKRDEERAAKKRLEELRIELRREMLSYGELAELESLKHHIDKDDVELRQAAGIPEFKRGGSVKGKIDRDRYVKLRRDKDKEIAKLKKEKGALRKATITKEKCDDKIETRLEGESNAIKFKESSGDNNQTLLIGGIAGILFGAFMIGR